MNNHSTEKSLSDLLRTQFKNLEAYCNAQTMLFNCTVENASEAEKRKAAAHLDAAIAKVRQDFQNVLAHQPMTPLLSRHIDRSRRVIQTICRQPGWNANGLPMNSPSVDMNTVALSAFRASMEMLLEFTND